VIAEMLAKHETYKAIAQRLGNQPATVRNQAHSIYKNSGFRVKQSWLKSSVISELKILTLELFA